MQLSLPDAQAFVRIGIGTHHVLGELFSVLLTVLFGVISFVPYKSIDETLGECACEFAAECAAPNQERDKPQSNSDARGCS